MDFAQIPCCYPDRIAEVQLLAAVREPRDRLHAAAGARVLREVLEEPSPAAGVFSFRYVLADLGDTHKCG